MIRSSHFIPRMVGSHWHLWESSQDQIGGGKRRRSRCKEENVRESGKDLTKCGVGPEGCHHNLSDGDPDQHRALEMVL